MDANVREILDLVFRWIHVVAGIMWIGHLYFFNFVNAQVVKTYDADSKKKVVPELMPRALYWFRWGAAYTWITGVLLLAFVFYHGQIMAQEGASETVALAGGVALWLIGPMIYDQLWKAMAKNEKAGVIVSYLLVVAVLAVMQYGLKLSPRAIWIHLGALFG